MLKNLLLLSLLLVLASGCSKSAKLSRHLERADAARQKGDLESARIEYLNANRLSPDNPEVLSHLGFIFLERGEIVPAAQLLNRVRQLQPTNTAVRLKLGVIFTAIGRFTNALEEAEYVLTQIPNSGDAAVLLANATPTPQIPQLEQRLQRLIAKSPDISGLHLALGLTQERGGKTLDAEGSYKQARALDSKSPKPALALGNLYWSQSRTNEARPLLKNASDLAPVRSLERLRYAEFQLRTGQAKESALLLEETTAQAPDFVLARTALAEIYLLERRTNECAAQIEQVLKLEPANASALLLRSRLKQSLGDSPGAIEDLERITRENPAHTAAVYELARLYAGKRDTSRALDLLDRALSTRTNFVQGILLRSELLTARGEFAAAIQPLARLTNQFPALPASYYLLASAFRARGTPEDALAVYRRMTELFPSDPQPFQFAGVTLRQQENLAEARQSYTRALQVQTNYLPAIDELIELDIVATNYPGALQRVQTYLALYPDKPMPRLLEAKVFVAQKKWAEAEAALKKAIEISPEFITAHRSLVTLYVTSSQTDQAIAKLRDLIAANPKEAGSMLQLGMLYEAKNDYSAARQTYEKLIGIQPNALYALNNLAYLLSEHFNDHDRAWDLIQKARLLNPNDPSATDTFGWIAYKRGDYPRALPVLQQAAEKLPGSAEVAFHLGMAHYMSGQQAPAVAALSQASTSETDFKGKDQARAALAILNIDPASPKPVDQRLITEALAKNPADLFALLRLAQLQQQQSDWAKAGTTYEAARKISPKSPRILLPLASLKAERLAQPQEGLALAKEAWNLSQDAAIAGSAGRVGVIAGDLNWALPLLQIAVRAQTRDPAVDYYHALAAYAHGDFESALKSVQRALGSEPFPEQSRLEPFRALLQFHLGTVPVPNVSAAVDTLLKLDPNFAPAHIAPAHIAAGLLLESRGDFPGARKVYESVLKQFPEHLLAQRQLAVLLVDRFDDEKSAAALAAKVRTHLPEDPFVSKVLGKVAYRNGDYREAARLLARATTRLPKNADLLYHLGMAEFHSRQKGAKTSLTEALALDPSGKLSADARKALAEIK